MSKEATTQAKVFFTDLKPSYESLKDVTVTWSYQAAGDSGGFLPTSSDYIAVVSQDPACPSDTVLKIRVPAPPSSELHFSNSNRGHWKSQSLTFQCPNGISRARLLYIQDRGISEVIRVLGESDSFVTQPTNAEAATVSEPYSNNEVFSEDTSSSLSSFAWMPEDNNGSDLLSYNYNAYTSRPKMDGKGHLVGDDASYNIHPQNTGNRFNQFAPFSLGAVDTSLNGGTFEHRAQENVSGVFPPPPPGMYYNFGSSHRSSERSMEEEQMDNKPVTFSPPGFEYQKEAHLLESANRDLTEKVAKLTEVLQRKQEEIESLKHMIAEKQNTSLQISDHEKRFKLQLRSKEDTISGLKASLSEMEGRLNSLQLERQHFAKSAETELRVQMLEAVNRKLVAEKVELEEKVKHLSSECRTVYEHSSTLVSQLEDSETRRTIATLEQQVLMGKVGHLNAELSEMKRPCAGCYCARCGQRQMVHLGVGNNLATKVEGASNALEDPMGALSLCGNAGGGVLCESRQVGGYPEHNGARLTLASDCCSPKVGTSGGEGARYNDGTNSGGGGGDRVRSGGSDMARSGSGGGGGDRVRSGVSDMVRSGGGGDRVLCESGSDGVCVNGVNTGNGLTGTRVSTAECSTRGQLFSPGETKGSQAAHMEHSIKVSERRDSQQS